MLVIFHKIIHLIIHLKNLYKYSLFIKFQFNIRTYFDFIIFFCSKRLKLYTLLGNRAFRNYNYTKKFNLKILIKCTTTTLCATQTSNLFIFQGKFIIVCNFLINTNRLF